jgi:hypothetical protein
MGIGDSIKKSAENAMEDLAGTSGPTDDAHVPEPGAPDEDIRVHSSISEGSNAMDDAKETPRRSNDEQRLPDEDTRPGGEGKTGDPKGSEADSAVREVPRDVPGPAGLPGPDPDALRADPSEGDVDPSKEMGRS